MLIPAPSFSLHIHTADPHEHAAPASVLVQILENTQKAFELIGVQVEGRAVRARSRVPTATAKRFQLICRTPEFGSYAIPLSVSDTGELIHRETTETAIKVFKDVMGLVDQLVKSGEVSFEGNKRWRKYTSVH